MDAHRQLLIERIYDSCEFPHCARNVYTTIYHALNESTDTYISDKIQNKLLDPMYESYKLSQTKCAEMSADIMETLSISNLEKIAKHVEDHANAEYPSDFDDGYDSF